MMQTHGKLTANSTDFKSLLCSSFGNMLKSVTMLYSAIKVQVHMINTYQGASEYHILVYTHSVILAIPAI